VSDTTAHPRIAARAETGPPKVADSAAAKGPGDITRFNAAFAVRITNGVGTMWCAYAFAALALVSLPAAIRSGDAVTLVTWISQTFIQLVLLSVIIVGQNIQAAAADKRSESTFEDAGAILSVVTAIQQQVAATDALLKQVYAFEPKPEVGP
jgi:hypothetical protein